jgi:hypothetical protein
MYVNLAIRQSFIKALSAVYLLKLCSNAEELLGKMPIIILQRIFSQFFWRI